MPTSRLKAFRSIDDERTDLQPTVQPRNVLIIKPQGKNNEDTFCCIDIHICCISCHALRSFFPNVAVVILVESHDAVEALKEQASNDAIELTMSNVCLGKAD